MIQDKNICVIGLGYVGLTLAITFAKLGFKVTGIKINKKVLKSLKKNKPHFYEPGLKESLTKVLKNKKLEFYKKIPRNWHGNTFIITVGTPLDRFKKLRMDPIKKVADNVKLFLKKNDHVILRSTVKVGTSRNFVAKILEKKKVNFDLSFCPERTQEGKALKEIFNVPQIIGGINQSSLKRSKKLFSKITQKILITSSLEVAEMIKLVDNSHRDVFFSYANEVAKMCDSLKISASEVINLGKTDYKRTNIALPGPVSGPCLVKDSYILNESIKNKIAKPSISIEARKLNEQLHVHVLHLLKNEIFKRNLIVKKISLLGLAFKGTPSTDDIRDSFSIKFYKKLLLNFKKSKIVAFDPLVKHEDFLKYQIKRITNIKKIFFKSDLVIILNNNLIFKKLNLNNLSKLMNNSAIIYDFWNLFDNKKIKLSNDTKYIGFGNLVR